MENCSENAQYSVQQSSKNCVASTALHKFIRVHSKTDFDQFKPYDDDEMLLPSNDERNHKDANEKHGGSICEMEMNKERD